MDNTMTDNTMTDNTMTDNITNMESVSIKKSKLEDGVSFKYSMTFNSKDRRILNILSYYLGNNISHAIQGKKLNSKGLSFDVATLDKINLSCNGFKVYERDSSTFQYFLSTNNDYYDFEYHNEKYQFKFERLGDSATGDVPMEYFIATVKYNDIVKLEDLFTESNKYYNKYYKEIDDDDKETFTIYSNEDSYWERISSREKRDLKYIYLPKKQKKSIDNDLINFMKEETKRRYSRTGVPYKRIYLLEGIPGAGKTSLITALASKHSYDVAILSLDPKMTDIKLCQAIKNLPKKCFLLIEDIDGLFVERKSGDNNKNCITVAGLLNSLDGIMTKQGLITFITTNFKRNLDSALIRPGRVDYIMKFEHIKVAQVKEMYRTFMENNFDEEKMSKFVDEYKSLNIEISHSLLQQYLFKYIDEPDSALENITDIKIMKEACTTNTNRNEDGKLYS
jgi:hypothetical protein